MYPGTQGEALRVVRIMGLDEEQEHEDFGLPMEDVGKKDNVRKPGA